MLPANAESVGQHDLSGYALCSQIQCAEVDAGADGCRKTGTSAMLARNDVLAVRPDRSTRNVSKVDRGVGRARRSELDPESTRHWVGTNHELTLRLCAGWRFL